MRVISVVGWHCFSAAKNIIWAWAILLMFASSAQAKIVQQLIDESLQINASSTDTEAQAAHSTKTDAQDILSQINLTPLHKSDDFKEVGRGEMQWWWFSLYRAKLLTLDGNYSQGELPLVLDIEYYQEIPSERLVEATLDQWQHLGLSKQRQQKWLAEIKAVWPDVVEGDKLTLRVLDSGVSQFYFNDEPLAKAMPKGFSDDFLAIWLSEQTSRPELRKQLLGELGCDC
ncbi:chalcone isomerase family protein [Shewanella pneumatophori]|uniref:Chalcone isomerase family protein n=1 Tax=Shewanella pneumatophori TaxID=314092 RepID=A0A9X1ZJ72_9GAMM|nr:chalcone isomerase family protein [Shewanella pneumatophori]MCL1138793.1 chalcone isomerase family protein [Shewanella pneumatophori]